jgi:hypothetical protein
MRIFLAVLLTTALSAQSTDLFSKAPPDVDAALRARVKEFYSLQVESKFRAAEKLVCEDSKDAYFDAGKRAWKSFEVVRVNYEPGFRSALVLTNLTGEMVTVQAKLTSLIPMTSVWKRDGESWCLHIPPPPKEVQTPFGVSKPSGETANPAVLGTAAAVIADPRRLMAEIEKQVQVSRTDMKLKSAELSSDEIEIRNGTAGPLEVSFIAPDFAGLKITLAPKKIPAGESGRVRLEYTPKDKNIKPVYNFTLTIDPLQRQVPVRVFFDPS